MEKAMKSLLVVGIAILMVASAHASFTFVGTDTTTGGNWIGKYGAAGYDAFGMAKNLTGGLSDSLLWGNLYSTPAPSDNALALQNPTGGRAYNCAYSNSMFELSLDLGTTEKQVAFYMDFGQLDGLHRALTIYTLDHQYTQADMYDFQATTGTDAHAMADGEWLIYKGSGHVDLKVLGAPSCGWANLGAVMIDPIPEPASMTLLALGGIGALLRRRK